MPQRMTRSLKHEYELFVENEIESYKESVPRSVLLGIGDEAVSVLSREPQFALTELLLCEEVDRIIFRRLRLPTYQTWRRRQMKRLDELRRPERWGLSKQDPVVRALPARTDAQVLVAGAPTSGPAMYLAAHGCEVTSIAEEADAVERVMQTAAEVGLATRVHARMGSLSTWQPESPLAAVIVSPQALADLSAEERARVIAVLKSATLDGGVHLVQAIAAAQGAPMLTELRAQYEGWEVSVERSEGRTKVFLARKGTA
jgi:hypothetical protein